MRLWLSKTSEVPVREQLATQIMLGVVSGDFAPGEKLPSTRELARRLQIHANKSLRVAAMRVSFASSPTLRWRNYALAPHSSGFETKP